MKVLVTGGAGFIGSHLVDRLLEDNEVVVIDDLKSGKEEFIKKHFDNKNFEFHRASVCDDIRKFLEDVEVAFHLAALPRVQYSIKHPIETNRVNVEGTLNLLNLSRESNVKRFVFSSSSSVYGEQKIPFKEDMKLNPISPYALQKAIGEKYCVLFSKIYGLDTVSLRYFNVYGPRQDPNGDYACVIPKFIKLVNEDKSPIINGSGTNTRDYTYVKDVVDTIINAGFSKKKFNGECFNVGNGKNISVNEVAKVIIGNKNIKPIHGPDVIEPKDGLADISKIKKFIGWVPKYSFEEGLEETKRFFKNI